MCLGDSFTNGLGVDADRTYAKVAERLLAPGTEVINAGVSATGTAEQLAWFQMDGARYRPDVVVLAFVVNDWTDNTKGGLFTFGPDSTLVQHPSKEPRSLHWLRKLRSIPGYSTWFARSHFLNRFRQGFAQRHHRTLREHAAAGADAGEVWRRERALTEALLRRLRDRVEGSGARLLLMPVPAQPGSGKYEDQESELAAFLDRERFEWIDLRGAIRARPDAVGYYYYPMDGHWTEAGHSLAGERLAERLEAMFG
jgi:lysophospholipase L1-like esterase